MGKCVIGIQHVLVNLLPGSGGIPERKQTNNIPKHTRITEQDFKRQHFLFWASGLKKIGNKT